MLHLLKTKNGIFKKNDLVKIQNSKGIFLGVVKYVSTWLVKDGEKCQPYSQPYIHVELDKPDQFGISGLWLWTDEHFSTLFKRGQIETNSDPNEVNFAGCKMVKGVGWVVLAEK